jgi:hypothetical protein
LTETERGVFATSPIKEGTVVIKILNTSLPTDILASKISMNQNPILTSKNEDLKRIHYLALWLLDQ